MYTIAGLMTELMALHYWQYFKVIIIAKIIVISIIDFELVYCS